MDKKLPENETKGFKMQNIRARFFFLIITTLKNSKNIIN